LDFYSTALLQGLGFCFLGAGIYLTLRIFNIPDITTDGSYTLGSAVTAVMLVKGFHPVIVLPAAAAAGAAAGVATGIIHTRLRVPALLAGILVMTALFSVNLGIMGRSNIPLLKTGSLFTALPSSGSPFADEIIVSALLVVLLVTGLVRLLHTDFGIAMRATGSNEGMVRAMGVNTDRMKVTGLALANALTAVSGYLITQYQGFCDINMGIGIVISGLASVTIGSVVVRLAGRGGVARDVLGVVAGTLVFRLILAGALSAGMHPNFLKAVTAVLVLAVLAAGRLVKRNSDD